MECSPSLLKCFESFIIPPYGKERLIFRCSGRRTLKHGGRLTGLMTMQIGDQCKKKMMVRFRIDRSNFKSAYNSFSVGFPDLNLNTNQIIQELKKSKRDKKKDSFYVNLTLSKDDQKKELFDGLTLKYPINPIPGDFHLRCMFGNGSHSRCVLILSKAPEEKESEQHKQGEIFF